MPSYKSVAIVATVCFLLLVASLSGVSAIKCYECDEFPGASDSLRCPGGNLITFGDKHDACIVYRLNSGRIVYQQEITSYKSALCSHTPAFLSGVIEQYFGEPGMAMCCRTDGCNKDVPEDYRSAQSEHIFLEDFRAEQAAGIQQESLRRASGDEEGADAEGSGSNAGVAALPMVVLLVAAAVGAVTLR